MNIGTRVPILGTCIFLLSFCELRAQEALPSNSREDNVRKIVQLVGTAPGPSLAVRSIGLDATSRARLHQEEIARRTAWCREVVAALEPDLTSMGGRVLQIYPMFHMCLVEIPRPVVAELVDHPLVRSLSSDGPARSLSLWSPSDPVPANTEHHRTDLAHAAGFTGAGSPTWAPVVAILDGWLLGFGTPPNAHHHQHLHEDGDPVKPTRVLADLDWDTANPLALPSRPLSNNPGNLTNVYHGVSIAGIVAGHQVVPSNGYEFTNGEAPNAGLVSINIIKSHPPRWIACQQQWEPAGYWAFQSQVLAGLNELVTHKFDYAGTVNPTRPIRIANLSYGGPPNPTHAVNDALRKVVADADILVVTAAGNEGALAFESYYNVNGLAVGSMDAWFRETSGAWNRSISDFSSRGPLTPTTTGSWCAAGGDADSSWPVPTVAFARQFPDLAAVGSSQGTALQDDETQAFVTSGTSLAAPHVAGAAQLLLAGLDGQAPTTILSSQELRAALLVTTENTVSHGNGDDVSGAGFLRTDRITYAKNLNDFSVALQTVTMTSVGQTKTLGSFPVTANERYAVAVSWPALDPIAGITNPNWLDLDLSVSVPGVGGVTSAATYGNRTWERVEFTAQASGTASITISAARVGASPSTPVPVAYAVSGVQSPLAQPANIVTTPTANQNITTCQVMQSNQSGAVQSFDSTANIFPAVSASQDARELFQARDDLWVAFRVDDAGTFANGYCSWAFKHGTSPRHLVLGVRLATNSPREMVLRCSLASSGFTAGSMPYDPSVLVNRWDGWLHVPAGAGYAKAEFYAETPDAPVRWFAAEFPPDVKIGEQRQVSCSGVVRNRPFGNGLVTTTSDPTGTASWSSVDETVFYDLKLLTAPNVYDPVLGWQLKPFQQGTPSMKVIEPPSLSGGGFDILLAGNEQMDPAVLSAALLILEASPSEGTAIQALSPMVNGSCMSILTSLQSTILVDQVWASSSGNGSRQNPAAGASGRIRIPLVATPSLLGMPFHMQVASATVVGSDVAFRPTNVVSVTLGY